MHYNVSFPFVLSEKNHNYKSLSDFCWWPNLASGSEEVAEYGPNCWQMSTST